MCVVQHLRHGLDNFNIKLFQSADTLQKLLSRFNFRLSNYSWIEDHSHIFGTLYYRDNLKCIQFLLAHLAFQAHLKFKLVIFADFECRRIYSKMNTGNWGWVTLDQLSAEATIVPVICASDKTHLTNFSDNHHTWLLYLMISNIRKDICCTPTKRTLILDRLIP